MRSFVSALLVASMKIERVRRAFALLALVAIAACRDGSTGPRLEPIEGAYTLRSINGAALPASQGGTFDVTIVSGVIELQGDGRYAERRTMRWSLDQGLSHREDPIGGGGAWKRIGDKLFFQDDARFFLQFEGTYANGTLTVDWPGEMRVYSR